jgi:glycosyltransferase involved in cell wall biosynthesis
VSAARERWWALLSRLASHHAITLVTRVPRGESFAVDGLPPGLTRVESFPDPGAALHDPCALLPRTVRGAFADPAIRAAVQTHLAHSAYDIAQFEWIEAAHLMPATSVPTILTVHQLGFAQEGPRWRAGGRPLHAALPALYRHLRDLDWELRAARRADLVVTMSDEDADRLRAFLPHLPIAVSPIGIDCAARALVPPPPSSCDVVFVGHFGHPPNVDAAHFLAREVAPRVDRPLRLRLVGHAPPPSVIALARPGIVEVAGAVDDLRAVLGAAAVVVAPVRFGTGMRGKVLEALAAARPIVTTALGAEGLGARSGDEILLAESATDVAAAIRWCLDHPAAAQRIGLAGRRLVERRFDWDAIASAHDDLYERALHDPRGPSRSTPDHTRWLRHSVGRLGRLPGLATGAAVVGAAAARWYLARALRATAGARRRR